MPNTVSVSCIDGVASTINCANYVYFLALEKCQLLQSPQVIPVFVTEVLNLHRGQGLDILWRDQCRCPTGIHECFDSQFMMCHCITLTACLVMYMFAAQRTSII